VAPPKEKSGKRSAAIYPPALPAEAHVSVVPGHLEPRTAPRWAKCSDSIALCQMQAKKNPRRGESDTEVTRKSYTSQNKC